MFFFFFNDTATTEIYTLSLHDALSISLDIGVVRDSTRNANNEFDLFSETFDGIAVNGYEVMSVTGTILCPTGETGQREAITCSTGS